MSSATFIEQLVNQALSRIGFPEYIGSIFDGTTEARAALNVYAQTRDELLRANDWGFAERNVSLTLLKQAPLTGYIPPQAWDPAQHPPPGWLFSYAYPSDCLKVRNVKPVPLFPLQFDPQSWTSSVENDNTFTPPQKVILCNVPAAMMVYTGQVTDPSTWEADFTEAMVAALGRRLAPVLVGIQKVPLAEADAAKTEAVAEGEQG